MTARQGLRLRTYLGLLVAAALLPVVIYTAYLSIAAGQNERAAIERGMLETSRALSLAVDREVATAIAALDALASSSSFQSGDYAAFRPVAMRFLARHEGWLSVVDEDGQQRLNTRLPPDAPLPRTDNREWLSNVFGADRIFITGAVTGPVVKQPFVAISLRIARPDKAVVLTLSISPETLSKVLREQELPPGWYGVIADRDARIIGRTQGLELAGQPMTVRPQGSSGFMRATTHEGEDVYLAWNNSTRSGWTTGVAAPAEFVDAALNSATQKIVLLGILTIVLAIASASYVSRKLTRPMAALAQAVTTEDQVSALPRDRSDLLEIDALTDAFRAKLGELRQAIAARDVAQANLRTANEDLERRVAERTRELEDVSANLMKAQKLESLGRLTGGIAHDFNNLLTAIQGNLELLERRITDERLSRYLANARKAAERGAKVTAQLLAFSRRQRLQPEAIDINEAVGSVGELLRSTLGGTIRVDTVQNPGVWRAMADRTQLEMMLLNLAINARDAMPMGGVLTIETANAVVEHGDDRPEEAPAGEHVVIAVTDTGSGMSEDVLGRIFEPFFTTKEQGKGSGLGLPHVLGVAKQLGGGIRVRSRPGEGTRVEIFLPRATHAGAQTSHVTKERPSLDLAGVRALLVDDDPDVRSVTASMLMDRGCQVVEAASGAAAIDLVRGGTAIDVAVIDYAMPGLNGNETARELAKLRPDLPVVLVSGYIDAQGLADTWSGPILKKPFRAAKLAEMIAENVTRPTNVVALRQ